MCRDLYALEKEAHDIYTQFLVDLAPGQTRDVIAGIQSDEEHHMAIAKQMLEVAERSNEN